MRAYTRTEAREWAREKLVGAVNCTIPSFTGDLRGINEKAIRHDIGLAKEHGFLGTLGVAEVSITLPEYLDFLRICKDEAGDDFYVVHHASWNNLEQNLEAVRGAEDAGADLVLLTYPPNFYPETEQEIFDYTKAVCDATGLGVILFPMTIWNFGSRIHPSDIPARLIRRMIDELPNVAVIKAEGGYPSIQNAVECHRLFGDEVVISVPIEGDLIPLSQVIPIQLSATSDHEYYGPVIPHVMQLLRDGKYDEATEVYWQLHPARKIKAGLFQGLHGGSVLNRQAWKFQGWLQGYNGGPLRMPTMRLQDNQMAALRKGLIDAGLKPSMDPFRDFFIGRNPS
jgi:4-hydroxy-tetrahydrodipicolinate synthase